jgi:hypothetical protein
MLFNWFLLDVYMLQDACLGKILGSVVLENGHSSLLDAKFESKYVKVLAEEVESVVEKMVLDENFKAR